MTRKMLVGNWKSNTSLAEATELAAAIRAAASDVSDNCTIGVAVPYPWLLPVKDILDGSTIWVGAQNCSATENGAYTGEVSATMVKDCAQFVIIGHSERRALYGETDDIVKAKIGKALDAGLSVILCVGEVLEQREAGNQEAVVQRQLLGALEGFPEDQLDKLVVAYEPVWAIGTGVAATSDDAEAMCAFIRTTLDERFGDSSAIFIQYGGSANDKNAAELLAKPNVGGLLIGGASLKADAFKTMLQAVS